FRSHIGTMFAADFRSTYRGTVLGIFWNFALPLVPISVYILLVNLKVFPQFEGLNPSVYISFNVALWMLFIGMINRPIQVVQQRTQQSMKTAIPLSAEIAASFAQLCFETLVRSILVAILVTIFGPAPETHLPLLIFTVFVGLFFCLSVGLFLSIFNMVYPDVNRLTGIFLQYAIFLSGVIFPVSTLGPLAVLENTNPFNVFIKSARDFLFFGTHTDMQPLYIWAGVAIIFTLIAGRFFYVMEHKVREVV
ncbi:MAG: ABC transporter permease, partial [Pseudomonadota bacterium]